MSLKSIRKSIAALFHRRRNTDKPMTSSLKGKGRVSYPRKAANQPVDIDSPTSEIKATKAGAVHYVGKPGTGGWARKVRRATA